MQKFLLLLFIGSAAAAPHIVGGKPIEISEAPYQLELDWKIFGDWTFKCGASIVGPTTIITAGHCVKGPKTNEIRLRSGTTNRGEGDIHLAKIVIQHPDYYELPDETPINDIAIIQVETPFEFGDNVQPVELTIIEPSSGDTAFISGWGYLTDTGPVPIHLYGVEIPIVSRDNCNRSYDGIIGENMICAGIPQGGKDSCQGDSGGPIVIDKKLVGIVSWGNGCAQPGFPGVYTNIAYFGKWIDKQKSHFENY